MRKLIVRGPRSRRIADKVAYAKLVAVREVDVTETSRRGALPACGDAMREIERARRQPPALFTS